MLSKLGQLFFIGIEGTDLQPHEVDFIIQNNIGGVILFDRNLESPEQIYRLCTEIQSLRERTVEKLPLFIGTDMEGGRVMRLKEPFTKWPALKKLGDLDSTTLSFKFGQCMGSELKSVGINVNFAPCTDTLTNPDNPVIGDRALSSDFEAVGKHASALVRGYIKSGIIACAKHFPGHGNTSVDSHLELPKEATTMEQLLEGELQPFKKVFRARLEMVMTGHLLFENIDAENPATFSTKFLKDLLRDDFRYQNIVVTDDLDMKALASHYPEDEIPVRALQAGCNMLLYCNDFSKPPMALEALEKAIKDHKIDMAHIDDSYQKVIQLKQKRLADFQVPSFTEAMEVIGCEEHRTLAEAVENGEIPEGLEQT